MKKFWQDRECRRVRPLLLHIFDPELEAAAAEAIKAHTARCPACAAEVERLTAVRAALNTLSAQEPPAPRRGWDDLRQRLTNEGDLPQAGTPPRRRAAQRFLSPSSLGWAVAVSAGLSFWLSAVAPGDPELALPARPTLVQNVNPTFVVARVSTASAAPAAVALPVPVAAKPVRVTTTPRSPARVAAAIPPGETPQPRRMYALRRHARPGAADRLQTVSHPRKPRSAASRSTAPKPTAPAAPREATTKSAEREYVLAGAAAPAPRRDEDEAESVHFVTSGATPLGDLGKGAVVYRQDPRGREVSPLCAF